MTEKTEALLLADALDALDGTRMMPAGWRQRTSAELRRLHAENERIGPLAERVLELKAQRDALLEACKPMIDHAEFWINHHQKRHMSEQEFRVWLALGHESNAMLNARAAIKAVEEQK